MKRNYWFGSIITILSLIFVLTFEHEPDDPDARVIVEWNELIISTASEVDRFQTLHGNRAVPLMHLAVHDALNAIVPVYEQYALKEFHPEAHPVAAASQAAHDVMAAIFPGHSGSAAELHQKWMDRVPENSAREEGVRVGRISAQAILEDRENSGYDSSGEFIPGNDPGEYRITPPFDEPIGAGWPDTEPLSMTSPDQFRPGPPPALNSETYARDFDEVKRLGRKDSEERTDDQTHAGYWFAEYPTVSFPDFARSYVMENDVHPWRAARLFALLAIDNFDGLISVFDAKYEYTFWRPYTAIRNADRDGNPATQPDPNWEPEMTTAPHPDYPAALSTLCAGGAEILKDFFGTSDFRYMRKAGSVPEGTPAARSYDSIGEAVEDCENSRIYNGYHFRTGLDVGSEMGRERAKHLLKNHLTRQPDTDYPELTSGESESTDWFSYLRLGAVEYAHVGDAGEPFPAGANPANYFSDEEAPRYLKISEEDGWEPVPDADGNIAFTALHVWVHHNNPDGVFAPFNPTID